MVIKQAKNAHQELSRVYGVLSKIIPDNAPEKLPITTRLVETSMWLRMFIEVSEAEINTPIKLRIADKSEEPNGNIKT